MGIGITSRAPDAVQTDRRAVGVASLVAIGFANCALVAHTNRSGDGTMIVVVAIDATTCHAAGDRDAPTMGVIDAGHALVVLAERRRPIGVAALMSDRIADPTGRPIDTYRRIPPAACVVARIADATGPGRAHRGLSRAVAVVAASSAGAADAEGLSGLAVAAVTTGDATLTDAVRLGIAARLTVARTVTCAGDEIAEATGEILRALPVDRACPATVIIAANRCGAEPVTVVIVATVSAYT